MAHLINYMEEIDKYNENQDYFYQILPMEELNNYLIEYGYEDYFSLSDIDIIDPEKFSKRDKFFWQNYTTGYLHSGSAKEAYHILIKNNEVVDEDDVNENEKLYRYEIIINNRTYGFIRGVDKLIELNLASPKLIRKINTCFSEMNAPFNDSMQNAKYYFTEYGFQHFQFAFKIIIPLLKKVCDDVKLIIINKNDIKKDAIKYIDKYQIVV